MPHLTHRYWNTSSPEAHRFAESFMHRELGDMRNFTDDSKAGESWTELDPADDSTYSLPIFLSVGKYSVAVAVAVMVKLLR